MIRIMIRFKTSSLKESLKRFPCHLRTRGVIYLCLIVIVIKTTPQSTTRTRPIFNASLKTGENPSINEAAYVGPNLLNDIASLLLYFRCDEYLLIADIRQAFHMIHLKSEEDKNRFCFFWREYGELVTYRYCTLPMGYSTWPFILNYVIKYHAAKYPNDICTQVLSRNLYCDNLIVTGHDEELYSLFRLTRERMLEGGFDLRSWASNSQTLESRIDPELLTQHGHRKDSRL